MKNFILDHFVWCVCLPLIIMIFGAAAMVDKQNEPARAAQFAKYEKTCNEAGLSHATMRRVDNHKKFQKAVYKLFCKDADGKLRAI